MNEVNAMETLPVLFRRMAIRCPSRGYKSFPILRTYYQMSIDRFPIGLEMDVFYPEFKVSLTLLSTKQLMFQIKEGIYARSEIVEIQVVPLGNSLFAVSWKEKDGATVINIQDYDRARVHSWATLPNGEFLRMTGSIVVTQQGDRPLDDRPKFNKQLVLEAMTTLFQSRDASSIERFYALNYIQHNPNIPQGREALKAIVENLGADVFYEPGLIVAEGDLVAIHGRIRGWAETPQVVVDLFRIEEGKLAEHWDVLQAEVPFITDHGFSMFDPDEATTHSHLRRSIL